MAIETGQQALAEDVQKLASLLFGDASDGDVVSSGDITLTRDMFYDSLTIEAGDTLYTKGFIVHVKDTLTFGDATAKIVGNGNDAVAQAAGGAVAGHLTGGAGAAAQALGFAGGGGAGGSSALVFAHTIIGAGTIEAKGGAGADATVPGSGGALIGSTGGAVTRGAAAGGAGGGYPGGGGTAGVTTQPTATYHKQEAGGAGGGSGGSDSNVSKAGGGGGGGAGNIIVVYRTKADALTLTVTGGVAGNGAGGGTNGTAGSAGISIELEA